MRYGLVNMLSDVGSLWSPVNLMGYFVCLSFSYNLMMSSLISKLYGFNARFPQKECKPKKKKKEEKTKEKDKPDSGDDEDLNGQFKEIKKMYK